MTRRQVEAFMRKRLPIGEWAFQDVVSAAYALVQHWGHVQDCRCGHYETPDSRCGAEATQGAIEDALTNPTPTTN